MADDSPCRDEGRAGRRVVQDGLAAAGGPETGNGRTFPAIKTRQHVNFCGVQVLQDCELVRVCVLACLFTQLINCSINSHSSEHGLIIQFITITTSSLELVQDS